MNKQRATIIFDDDNSGDNKNDTTAFENQQKNIKVSAVRKRQIDTLGEVIGTRFAYETIGELIDNYVATRLTPDQQRAFQALSSLNTLK